MKSDKKISISGLATGIGSLPYLAPKKAVDLIFSSVPGIPFWPQLVKKDKKEDMIFQYLDGMPAIIYDSKKDKLVLNPGEDKENALTKMYEKFIEGDLDFFKITRERAGGLYYFLENTGQKDLNKTLMIKGHVTGPFTFAFSAVDSFGKSLLYDEPMLEAIAKVLSMKAVWQAEQLKNKSGKNIIIFFDEPYLSSFGSAFCPLTRERVITLLEEIFAIVKEKSNALTGVHCCGNTDWPMLFESGVDIVNFDAWSYAEKFTLYPAEVKKFLEKGGILAWGIVPTNAMELKISIEDLKNKFQEILNNLANKGIDRELMIENSIFTPSCGLGTKSEKEAEYVLGLLKHTKELVEIMSK
ncbi:MAG: uroporphyrinogen decarboxylase family protein [bacterium]